MDVLCGSLRQTRNVRDSVRKGALFELKSPKVPHHSISIATPDSKSFYTSLDFWHCRLGHASFSHVKS